MPRNRCLHHVCRRHLRQPHKRYSSPDGSLKIERKGDTYTITYSFVDDNVATPHTISGTYTGTVELTNVEGETPDPEKPDPDKPDPDKPDPDEPAKPLIDLIAGGNLGQFTDGGRW